MGWVDALPDLLLPGSAGGLAGWLFVWLLRRGDRREADAFREVKEQRDYWRERTESAESDLEHCHHELAIYRAGFGLLDETGGYAARDEEG